MKLFKNACSIHTRFPIMRYLMSNADGREDGAKKAARHIELCSFYVAVFHGVEPDLVIGDYPDDFDAVHEATQELTSYLDERIGFPLKGRPDYDLLAPLFFEQFYAIAMKTLFKRHGSNG